jgi:hypothetical protein
MKVLLQKICFITPLKAYLNLIRLEFPVNGFFSVTIGKRKVRHQQNTYCNTLRWSPITLGNLLHSANRKQGM